MTQTEIQSFVHFISSTDAFSLVTDELILFRGQPVSGKLLPSVARENPKKDETEKEKEVLEQLKLQGASMLNGADATPLDFLVMAQHYGLRTRLLDWTSNPLFALWFACSARESGDVFVYALEASGLMAKDVYEQDPFSVKKTRVFQPRLNNPRIIAQQGWFTLHRYSKANGRFVALENNTEAKIRLHEFKILEGKRGEMLDALDRHGVSARTVFPDLAGLCQHLNWRYQVGGADTRPPWALGLPPIETLRSTLGIREG